MNFEVVRHVDGFTDEDIKKLAAEAEAGYDPASFEWEPNPHFQLRGLLPRELADAVEARANRDGQSPQEVIRQALTRYLESA